MKAYIVYNKSSGDLYKVEDFLNLIDSHLRPNIKLVDRQTPEGSALMNRFGVVSTPALIVATDAGQLVNAWQNSWPLSSEVGYYLSEVSL